MKWWAGRGVGIHTPVRAEWVTQGEEPLLQASVPSSVSAHVGSCGDSGNVRGRGASPMGRAQVPQRLSIVWEQCIYFDVFKKC